jgi:membrane fusion protein (multidrug efflux system)
MTKRTKRIVIWTAALAAITALALPKLTSSRPSSRDSAADKRGNGAPSKQVSVKAYVVTAGQLDDRISVTGSILPNEQIDLQSEVPGKIVRIYFAEGSQVRKGTPLVKINDADLQAQLTRAIYERQLAQAKEERGRQLREKQAVSPAEYDIALNELNTASASISLIRAQIAKTLIVAPFSGTVGLRQVSQGSYISPSTKIATLSSIDPVKVEFAVPEKYFGAVRRGSRIGFRVAGSAETYEAQVYAVEPQIDQATRTLQVRALCANHDGRIVPGAFAQIDLTLKEIGNAVMVPTEAVVPELQGKKVFIARNGKAESKPVEVGIRTDRSVQITSGLSVGDTVITSGILQVKPGSPLKISEFELL